MAARGALTVGLPAELGAGTAVGVRVPSAELRGRGLRAARPNGRGPRRFLIGQKVRLDGRFSAFLLPL